MPNNNRPLARGLRVLALCLALFNGWLDATETSNVTLELVRRGYSEEEIRKLWGGNLLRVWAENQKRAKPKA